MAISRCKPCRNAPARYSTTGPSAPRSMVHCTRGSCGHVLYEQPLYTNKLALLLTGLASSAPPPSTSVCSFLSLTSAAYLLLPTFPTFHKTYTPLPYSHPLRTSLQHPSNPKKLKNLTLHRYTTAPCLRFHAQLHHPTFQVHHFFNPSLTLTLSLTLPLTLTLTLPLPLPLRQNVTPLFPSHPRQYRFNLY